MPPMDKAARAAYDREYRAKNKDQRYGAQKAAWLRANPDATAEQVERAFQAIARRLGI